jgi:hypothetical protein
MIAQDGVNTLAVVLVVFTRKEAVAQRVNGAPHPAFARRQVAPAAQRRLATLAELLRVQRFVRVRTHHQEQARFHRWCVPRRHRAGHRGRRSVRGVSCRV